MGKNWTFYNKSTKTGTFIRTVETNKDMTKTTITWDANVKLYKISFGFLRDRNQFDNMLALLKKVIPSSDRSFDKANKIWLVAEHQLDAVKMVSEAFYKFVEVVPKEKVEKHYEEFKKSQEEAGFQSRQIIISDELKLFTSLIRGAGLSINDNETDGKVARKLYLRAIMVYHPDRNPGNADIAEKASQLNASWFNLQEYFGLEKKTMEQLS